MEEYLAREARPEMEEGKGSPWAQALLRALSWLVILLMLAIVLQVLCSALDINPLAQFASALPLLGKGLTLNSLLDLQWHLLVIVGLLPAGVAKRWDSPPHAASARECECLVATRPS